MRPAFGYNVILWILFFIICMSLGYPTLNRYDPRSVPGLSDSIGYYSLVTGVDVATQAGDESHRVLVPYLARPVYWMAKGHLNTWNPIAFALLVSNSFFVATAAFILVSVGRRTVGNEGAALLSGLLYLTSFAVANLNLSGYVDSAVNCLIMALVWAMLAERWWLLPVFGALGALSKETFIPLSAVFALGWWFAGIQRRALRLAPLAWIASMVAVGFAVLTLLMSRGPSPSTPMRFAISRWDQAGSGLLYLSGLYHCLVAREFLFTFAWLLPLGIGRLRQLPKPWVVGSTGAALAALAMGAYDNALGNAARAVFTSIGPVLSLSVSLLLLRTPPLRDGGPGSNSL